MIATQLSGGDSRLFDKALEILNYPAVKDEREQLVSELIEAEAELQKLKQEIQARKDDLKILVKAKHRLYEFERLREHFGRFSFWGVVKSILETEGIIDEFFFDPEDETKSSENDIDDDEDINGVVITINDND
ncbi:MAG: hypothetical protein F6K39_30290 [Okeania sp. SIO3B3]|nr:hypothetical protein [Okeania sp. SIO3B3]